jgi:hypothetical protein
VTHCDRDGTNQIIPILFRGREDASAIRWEKGNKSGYMPSYQFDPYHYRTHKLKGGTLANYQDKTLQPSTDEQIKRHLSGDKLIGIHPLLLNNTSHVIAADFDGENWVEEARKFLQACDVATPPVYLERSRSGNGGHVWLFFSDAYPAFRAAGYSCPYFNRQESFQYLTKTTQVLIGSFPVKTPPFWKGLEI